MSDIVNQTFEIIGPHQSAASANSPDDYCSEIMYNEVDICHIHAYMARSRRAGCCLSIPLFFGLNCCNKGRYPTPTDEGVPKSLPELPLGFHYPQQSTDRAWGRARAGVWAKERGQIYVAPWIQSTETVILKWDGIKRSWSDADPVSEDPKIMKAIRLYVREQHQHEWDKEQEEAAIVQGRYAMALADLIHQCREETRVRGCRPSHARAANGITALYYNDDQSAAASCPDGTTGQGVSVTVPAGTIASNISKADANQKAQAEAQRQAEARLDCTPDAVVYTNDEQTATAFCQITEGSPPPEGVPVTRTVPAGTVTSTISKADANLQAQAMAQQLAAQALSCVYWNSQQEYLAVCDNNSPAGDKTATIAAHTYSSTLSQADADAQALNAAKAAAEAQLDPSCTSGGQIYYNTEQRVTIVAAGCRPPTPPSTPCSVTVNVTIAAGHVTSTISQLDANQRAQNFARQMAQTRATQYCNAGQCGTFDYTF